MWWFIVANIVVKRRCKPPLGSEFGLKPTTSSTHVSFEYQIWHFFFQQRAFGFPFPNLPSVALVRFRHSFGVPKCLYMMKGFIWFGWVAIFLVSPPVTLVVVLVVVVLVFVVVVVCQALECKRGQLYLVTCPTSKWKINIKHMLILNKSLKFPYAKGKMGKDLDKKCGATTAAIQVEASQVNKWMANVWGEHRERERDRESEGERVTKVFYPLWIFMNTFAFLDFVSIQFHFEKGNQKFYSCCLQYATRCGF